MTQERRQYERFETEARVYFYVAHDLKTKVQFQVIDLQKTKKESPKYQGISKNISAGGIGFVSEKKLGEGEVLYIEVYLPQKDDPIPMVGEVRWSKVSSLSRKTESLFETGVKLTRVAGKSVEESIYYDEPNKIVWSSVLESIFGTFRILQQQKRIKSKNE